jgi:non-homologous end joining protein Ku
MIEARAAGKETPQVEAAAPKASNVVNLMDVLQRSLEQSKKSRGDDDTGKRSAREPAAHATSSASAAEPKPKKTARRKKSAA